MAEVHEILVDHAYRQHHKRQEAGWGRDQIRAVIRPGKQNRRVLEEIAKQLTVKHSSKHSLVTFVDDIECLERWDGTGAVEKIDNPNYLCQIVVDNRGSGAHVMSFEFAKDWETGIERKEAFEPESA